MNHRIRNAIVITCVFAFSLVARAQPTTQPAPGEPGRELAITGVAARPKLLAALDHEKVNITFNLSTPARAVLRVFDQWRRLVRTEDLGRLAPGEHTAAWDGRDDAGKLCRGHRFLYTLTARDDRRHSAVYDPSDQGAGAEIQPQKFVFDRKTGRLSYVLPRPAMVRIRLGVQDGPLMRTLVDWEPQLAGAHEIAWDGKDASGAIPLGEMPNLNAILAAYALPPNCLLVRENPAESRPELANEAPPKLTTRPGASEETYLHWSCNPARCHEPRFGVSLPEAAKSDAGLPLLAGKTPIRIEIDPRDRAEMVNRRFEVMFFVDGVFLFEEEAGTTPFTYYWDTTGVAPGRHFLTVNIIGYDDHVGTATQAVMIGGGQ